MAEGKTCKLQLRGRVVGGVIWFNHADEEEMTNKVERNCRHKFRYKLLATYCRKRGTGNGTRSNPSLDFSLIVTSSSLAIPLNSSGDGEQGEESEEGNDGNVPVDFLSIDSSSCWNRMFGVLNTDFDNNIHASATPRAPRCLLYRLNNNRSGGD